MTNQLISSFQFVDFRKVVTAVIVSGRNLSQRQNISVPLMYEWYEEFYLGGAHGIAGIMYLILQVRLSCFRSSMSF